MINASRIFYAYFFLFLSDECQTIAQRQDDYFHPRVVGNQVIECSDALSLMVTVVGWVDDVPVPQRIVCQNISARIQNLHHHLVCLDIGALVAIHENQPCFCRNLNSCACFNRYRYCGTGYRTL